MKIKPSQPYQPLLLRLLHSVNAFLVIGALISGFLVYDSWDGRFGGLGLFRKNRELIDIHGTFGFFLLFAFIAFAIYSIRIGRKRLAPADTAKKLQQVGKPIWWWTLHQLANTLMLVAVTLAVVSGKLQNEHWLPKGQLNHPAYLAHLLAWLILALSLGLHLLMSAKAGGLALWQSMVNVNYRAEEDPRQWPAKVRDWLRHPHW